MFNAHTGRKSRGESLNRPSTKSGREKAVTKGKAARRKIDRDFESGDPSALTLRRVDFIVGGESESKKTLLGVNEKAGRSRPRRWPFLTSERSSAESFFKYR